MRPPVPETLSHTSTETGAGQCVTKAMIARN